MCGFFLVFLWLEGSSCSGRVTEHRLREALAVTAEQAWKDGDGSPSSPLASKAHENVGPASSVGMTNAHRRLAGGLEVKFLEELVSSTTILKAQNQHLECANSASASSQEKDSCIVAWAS